MLFFPFVEMTPPFCEGGACSCEYQHAPGKKPEEFLNQFLGDSLELVWNRMGCPGLQKEKSNDKKEKDKGETQQNGEEFWKKLFDESLDLVRNRMGGPGLQKEKSMDEKEKDKGEKQQNGEEFLKKLFEESLDLVRNQMGGPGLQKEKSNDEKENDKGEKQQEGEEFWKKLFEQSLDLVRNQMGFQENEEPKDEQEKKGKEQQKGGEFLKNLFDESLDLVWNQMGCPGLEKKAKTSKEDNADKQQELPLKKDVFCIPVETTGYEPGEITVTVKNRTLKIHGKHEEKSDGSFVSREFRREFPIPADVDPDTIVAELEPEGLLSIRAKEKLPEKVLEPLPEATEQKEIAEIVDEEKETQKETDVPLVKTEIATLATEGFKPDEITVKVREGKVLVHAKHEEKESESFVLREMRREFPIPSEVHPDTIVADMSGDGLLSITASQAKKDEGQIQEATEDYVVVSDETVTEQNDQREVAVRIHIPAEEVSEETSS